MQIAVVATARKLAVFCRHLVVKGEDYAFQRPSLTEKKLRARVSAPPCPRGAVRRASGRLLAQGGTPA
jgi:transposase